MLRTWVGLQCLRLSAPWPSTPSFLNDGEKSAQSNCSVGRQRDMSLLSLPDDLFKVLLEVGELQFQPLYYTCKRLQYAIKPWVHFFSSLSSLLFCHFHSSLSISPFTHFTFHSFPSPSNTFFLAGWLWHWKTQFYDRLCCVGSFGADHLDTWLCRSRQRVNEGEGVKGVRVQLNEGWKWGKKGWMGDEKQCTRRGTKRRRMKEGWRGRM